MENTALSVQDLYFRYPDYTGFRSRILFSSLSFELKTGSLAVLFGLPDSGKTTLSRILGGLIPRFTGGELKGDIIVNGKNIKDYKPYELIEDIGIVFQNPEEEIFTTRCDTEVAFALESLGIKRDEIEHRVEQSLRAVGMLDYKEKNPVYLSGGEKKRLLIAGILAVDPSVWVFDEVFEELDPWIRETILSYIADNNKSVLILSSKWLEIYRKIVDVFFVLENSRLSAFSKDAYREMNNALKVSGLKPEIIKKPKKLINKEKSGGNILEIRNLEFRYNSNNKFALNIKSLKLVKGEIVGIVGENGSGKSTLARLLCGLLKPQKGSIIGIDGIELLPEDLNGIVGYLFQNPDFQIFLPTVEDELKLGLINMGMSSADVKKNVSKAIKLFNLPDACAPPSLISYGTKRKLQAAVYYLLKRPVVILDEADSGLSISDLVTTVSNLYSEDSTLVVISHDMETVTQLTNRLLYMKNGELQSGKGQYR